MKAQNIMILFSLLFLCIACENNDTPPDVKDSSRREIAALKSEIVTLKSELSTLKYDFQNHQEKQSLDDLIRSLGEVAYLTPGSSGYSIVKTNIGALTVSLIDVSPYANGSRIALQFGNVTGASIRGVSTTLEWGNVDSTGAPDNNTAKKKTESFAETFNPGSWTTVHVVLEGIPTSQLGFVRVKNLTHTSISLRK
jgi:hypothetical protein